MTFNSLNKYSIHKNSTLNIALKKFDKTGNKCLIVLDSHNNFIGTLSNSDIRRSILKEN